MDDLDVEAMLDEAMMDDSAIKEGKSNKENGHSKVKSKRSATPERKRRSRSRDHTRSNRSKESSRYRSRSQDRDRRDRGRQRRSRSRDRRRSRERTRSKRSPRRSSRRSPRSSPGGDRRSRDSYQKQVGLEKSPERSRRPRNQRMTPEERDARTVFCMQVSQRIRPSDLQEFFSSVGRVQDVRVITDNKTRRSKGIAYIEFAELESVSLALGLDGQKLLGVPIIVQASQAEKNRAIAATPATTTVINKGPMRLYVGNLHQNITEEMMTGIFEPFGNLDCVTLIKNDTGSSKGYGFVSFKVGDDGLKAIEQLNGFELAGRCMKLHQHGSEGTSVSTFNSNASGPGEDGQTVISLDADDTEKKGFDLGATGRLALMAKLAKGTDIKVPSLPNIQSNQPSNELTTQCFMLSNMFSIDDMKDELSRSELQQDITEDIVDACDKHGGCLHVFVNPSSTTGEVYVKCPSIRIAGNVVKDLHGRYFAGKQITAAFVPLINYHTLFPGCTRSVELLKKRSVVESKETTTGMAAIPPPPSYGA